MQNSLVVVPFKRVEWSLIDSNNVNENIDTT